MIALALVVFVLGLIVGVLRRGGLALGTALFVGFLVAFGQGPPEFAGGLYATIVVFVAARLVQSYARSREPRALVVAWNRLAGRAVYSERGSPRFRDGRSGALAGDEGSAEGEGDDAAKPDSRLQRSCEGRPRG